MPSAGRRTTNPIARSSATGRSPGRSGSPPGWTKPGGGRIPIENADVRGSSQATVRGSSQATEAAAGSTATSRLPGASIPSTLPSFLGMATSVDALHAVGCRYRALGWASAFLALPSSRSRFPSKKPLTRSKSRVPFSWAARFSMTSPRAIVITCASKRGSRRRRDATPSPIKSMAPRLWRRVTGSRCPCPLPFTEMTLRAAWGRPRLIQLRLPFGPFTHALR